MDENDARFWTVIFGAITSVGLIAAGIYSLIQFEDGKQKDRAALRFQAAATDLSARQYFNNKLLDNCTAATNDAATIAKGEGSTKQGATDAFIALSKGPMKIFAGFQVERAMTEFERCLDKAFDPRSSCKTLEQLATDVGSACKTEVTNSFRLQDDPKFYHPTQ